MRAWVENYETICKACMVDPAQTFPNYCVAAVITRLRQKGVSFEPNSWGTQLKKLILETYGRPVNRVQLQASIHSCRQGLEQSVSEYADHLDSLVSRRCGTRTTS